MFDRLIFKHGCKAFRSKLQILIKSFFCLSIPKRDLEKTPPNIEVCPESLRVMLEYWRYIKCSQKHFFHHLCFWCSLLIISTWLFAVCFQFLLNWTGKFWAGHNSSCSKTNEAFHWLNCYPVHGVIHACFVNTFPLNSDLSRGYYFPAFEKPNPRA